MAQISDDGLLDVFKLLERPDIDNDRVICRRWTNAISAHDARLPLTYTGLTVDCIRKSKDGDNTSGPNEYGCKVAVRRYKDPDGLHEEASESVIYNRENVRFDETIWNSLRNSIIVGFYSYDMPFSDAQLVKIRSAIGTNIVVDNVAVHAWRLRRATPQGFMRFIHSLEPKCLDIRMQRGHRLIGLEEAKLIRGPRFLVLRGCYPDRPSVRVVCMPYSKWMPVNEEERPLKIAFNFDRNDEWAEDCGASEVNLAGYPRSKQCVHHCTGDPLPHLGFLVKKSVENNDAHLLVVIHASCGVQYVESACGAAHNIVGNRAQNLFVAHFFFKGSPSIRCEFR